MILVKITRTRVILGIFIAIMKTLKKSVSDSKVMGMNRAYANIIVDRILSLCCGRDISINKLADMSGVKQSTLDNLVNGKTFNPTAVTLHKIAIAFNMTFSEFLDYPEMNNYSFADAEE